jgi:mycofactocin system glycosyltransferase
MSTDRLPPPDLVVRVASDVIVRDGGGLVIGGAPLRLLRLSRRGAQEFSRWRDGGLVGTDGDVRSLARRMLDAGILLPDPRPVLEALEDAVTVAIPVKDRPDELARCLAAVAADAPGVEILVVDDASADRARIARIAATTGASVLRLDDPLGPAAARNAALKAAQTPLVAFVDSDVVVQLGWLARLVADFADPTLAAAAPRVGPLNERGSALTEYEAQHSSLDMGPRPAPVGVGHSILYIPSAAMVVRRSLVQDGFDPSLAIGEDVDLVWRLAERGWRVLYDPTALVRHDHRVAFIAFVRRRVVYARSIGLLARRHPDALPAVWVEPWSLAALLLACWGNRRSTAAAAATLAARTVRRREELAGHTPHPTSLAIQLMSRSLVGTSRGLGHAVRRSWSPLLIPLAMRSRRARVVLAASVLATAVDEGVRPAHVPFKMLDDLLAAVGTWSGCVENRTFRPLLPARIRQMASPPSTGSAAPVMPFASGPANQQMAAAISSGVSSRSSGC